MPLPTVQYRDSDQIPSDHCMIFLGIDCYSFKISDLNEILNFIAGKHCLYCAYARDRITLSNVLASCWDDVRQDNFQYAYEKYRVVYYVATLMGYECEAVLSLAEAGNLQVKNASYHQAMAFLSRAAALSGSPNLAAPTLKAQVNVSAGEASKLLGNPAAAAGYFTTASWAAFSSNNSSLLMLALNGFAETSLLLGDYNRALLVLQQSKKLVLSQPAPEYQMAFHLEQSINRVQQAILEQAQLSRQPARAAASPDAPRLLFGEIKKAMASILIQSLAGAFVCKLFGGGGSIALTLFGSPQYNIINSRFRGTTAIGSENLQKVTGS
jgi:tetratricopeptide (TPR) repeat protein